MAAVETQTVTSAAVVPSLALQADPASQSDAHTTSATAGKDHGYRYAQLLPVFVPHKYPPLTPFDHVDPGSRALSHANPRAFLDSATSVVELTPHIGTEVTGVSLVDLDATGRDQLALEVARRKLLVFRNQQEFINKGPEYYKQWGSHFGRLHIHPTSGHPAGYPEIHLVYKDPDADLNFFYEASITSIVWHADVSYELQPPGLTTFFLLAGPPTGGDTLFTSQVQLLRQLSTPFVAFLRTLRAVHSGVEQAEFSRAGHGGGLVRREPVEHVHPVVRRHPVTGEEALYVNREFTRRIVGLKREESENILNFLYDHIARSGDAQARVKWAPGTVILWDNRVTAHSAIVDFGDSTERRHGARITPQAERPVPSLAGLALDG